jgi:hypothetical protein
VITGSRLKGERWKWADLDLESLRDPGALVLHSLMGFPLL